MYNHKELIDKYKELELNKTCDGDYCFASTRFVIIPMNNGHCIFLNSDILPDLHMIKGYKSVDEFIVIYNALK